MSGIDLEYLKPRNWDELVEGVAAGAQSLGTVRMPYDGSDPWPRAALEIGGALLLTLSAQLACWPRGGAPRGYPFLALIGLLVLVVSPVVSLGGTRPLLLGAAIAALTVCFLWLERLPLRPGIGVAALLGVALAGALPLAAVADRGEPWFDYKAFAEGLGPDDPVRFSWNQDYGPIDWPRDGNEVMRVTSDEPHYWKAVNLSAFDGTGWNEQAPDDGGGDFEDELREDWRNKPGWQDRIEVSVRRMRMLDVPAPGTIMKVENATRPLRPSGVPGRWVGELGAAPRRLLHGRGLRPEADGRRGAPGRPHGLPRRARRPARDHRAVPARAAADGALGRRRDRRADRLRGRPLPAVRRRRGRLRHLSADPPHALRRDRQHVPPLALRSARGSWPSSSAPPPRRRSSTSCWSTATSRTASSATPSGRSSRRPGVAPLDAFLIDTKEGYCQHFSGAMALLLRMGGIPARVATGFSPGGFSKRRNAWIVRDTDAHAWVEAWFDELGWVTYDPTPDATPARSQIAALEAAPPPIPASPTGSSDAGRRRRRAATGRRCAPTCSSTRCATTRPRRPARRARACPGGCGRWPARPRSWSRFGLVRWLRARRRRGAVAPLDRAVAELEAALRRAGRPVSAGTTLRQLEHRLGAPPEATAYLRALSASRYGPAPQPPTSAQRKALRRALAQGLGPTGRLRAFWALPPRPR